MAKPIQVLGADELMRKLRMVGDAVKGKELRRATQAGAGVVVREARRRVPVRSGKLRRAIGTRSKILSPVHVEIDVGVRRKVAWYGHLIEFGHKIVRGRKTVGHAPARPFLRPAIEETQTEVIQKVREVFSRNLDKLTRGNR